MYKLNYLVEIEFKFSKLSILLCGSGIHFLLLYVDKYINLTFPRIIARCASANYSR